MARKIVWIDLPARKGVFTKRNTTMVSLDTGGILQYYGANTKINVAQQATVNGVVYYRTGSAAIKGLNWAFKASAFDLPKPEVASLEPSKESLSKTSHTHSRTQTNKNVPKTQKPSESEGEVSEDRKRSLISAFKRFFGRK